jgi:hypothetical protein
MMAINNLVTFFITTTVIQLHCSSVLFPSIFLLMIHEHRDHICSRQTRLYYSQFTKEKNNSSELDNRTNIKCKLSKLKEDQIISYSNEMTVYHLKTGCQLHSS